MKHIKLIKSYNKEQALNQLQRVIIENGSLHAHGYLLIHLGYENLTFSEIDELSSLIISR